jgi:hypothetical protein
MDDSFALTRKVAPTGAVALKARHIVFVTPAPIFVVFLGSERGQRHATVGHGDLRRSFDVFSQLGVYFVGVDPRGNRSLTRGERDTPDVLTASPPVSMVGTCTPTFAGIDGVLSVLILSDDSVNVAALGENGHILR